MVSIEGQFAVVGGGAWGTALASVIADKQCKVLHWMRDAEAAQSILTEHENKRYLPGIKLSSAIEPTADFERLKDFSNIFVVVPTQSLRATMKQLKPYLQKNSTLILCAKGIEHESGYFPSQIVEAEMPEATIAVLSGPSFACDVVQGLPTAVTLASNDATRAKQLAHDISGRSLRVYHGIDIKGVEIGGAAKNVYAIGCGAIIGRGLGESAKAALIARSFAELLRFAECLGGKPETLMGLSGLGDLLLTCNSPQSRNFSLGLRIGQGVQWRSEQGQKLAEGAFTAPVLAELAQKHNIDMPVAQEINAILAGTTDLDAAIAKLLARPVKPEYF